MSTSAESGIPTIASTNTNPITVDSDCTIRWDTTGGQIGNVYAVSIALEKASGIRSTIDFLVELVDGDLIPQCSSEDSSGFSLYIGDEYSNIFTGTDPNSGENLVLSSINLPPGSTLTQSGDSSNPFSALFQFTATTADTYIFFVLFTNSLNLQASCSFTFTVISVDDPCDNDADAPVFDQTPSNIVIDCSDVIPPPLNLKATDDCSEVTVIFSEVSSPGCSGVITRTWIATDIRSNTASVSQIITIVDNNQCVGPCYKCKDTTISPPRNIWLTTTSVRYSDAEALCQSQGGHIAYITKADFRRPNQLLGKCFIKDAWINTVGGYHCMVFTNGPIGSTTQQNCNLQKRVICESP
eukprot:TRINITY_DN2509_c0_g1_i7.p1 TRINITY_DN2509_c0_g1~~TRINITY_DN2509_c0_g1_i7.p1  ORF type:complete len:354 (-),score=52.30 TRINITY_DN2509_c0_g1_i7:25-1086(-)